MSEGLRSLYTGNRVRMSVFVLFCSEKNESSHVCRLEGKKKTNGR